MLACAASNAISPTRLSDMSLEELADIEVTSVSKRPEPLSDAAAAIYVIGNEDIRRSGARSIPEALRLAPNLQVARIDGSTYAITARGFNNGSTANKLLVLIDGRSVYTPLFSGVFWDIQDVVLADVDRIEVISGPGGTLWGANAVNGVINIITRSSRDTPGTLLEAGIGNTARQGTARYGGRQGSTGTFRVYGVGLARDNSRNAQGADMQDGWSKTQGGFRMDRDAADTALTLQGDIYDGSLEQQAGTNGDRKISGGNLLGRWSRQLGKGSSLQLQTYADQTNREYPGLFEETLNTWDVSLQHHYNADNRQDIVWGGGYRQSRDQVRNGTALAFLPADKNLTLGNFFAQYTVALRDDLKFTIGSKFEDNTYTGTEVQPNARLAWKISRDALIWSAVSRALRTPSRIDREFYVPADPPFQLAGGPGFQSEKLTAYEIGYRGQPNPHLQLSVSVFHNDYEDLRSIEGPPYVIANGIEGNSEGGEAWGTWQATEWWQLSAGYSYLRKHLVSTPGSISGVAMAGNDPPHQFFVRSSMNLSDDTELDLRLRSIARLPYSNTPEYTILDTRIAWQVSDNGTLSLNVDNLMRPPHVEFGDSATESEMALTCFVDLRWNI